MSKRTATKKAKPPLIVRMMSDGWFRILGKGAAGQARINQMSLQKPWAYRIEGEGRRTGQGYYETASREAATEFAEAHGLEIEVKPPVTMRKMPDGSFRIYGLGAGGQVHLKAEMRPWHRGGDETGETFYTSWSRREADIYASAHGLTILGPTDS